MAKEESFKSVSFSQEDLKEFKKLYEATPAKGIFIYKGNEFLKEYAKYVIEYLEGKFAEKR